MNDVKKFLADLEESPQSATPEKITRLVAMVRYLAYNAGQDVLHVVGRCAYHELHLNGKRCPLFQDSILELDPNATDQEWYEYTFGEEDGDEIACSTNTTKCWLYAAYKNTEKTA